MKSVERSIQRILEDGKKSIEFVIEEGSSTSKLTPDDEKLLGAIATSLKGKQKMEIEVHGHIDCAEEKMKKSLEQQQRAQKAIDKFIRQDPTLPQKEITFRDKSWNIDSKPQLPGVPENGPIIDGLAQLLKDHLQENPHLTLHITGSESVSVAIGEKGEEIPSRTTTDSHSNKTFEECFPGIDILPPDIFYPHARAMAVMNALRAGGYLGIISCSGEKAATLNNPVSESRQSISFTVKVEVQECKEICEFAALAAERCELVVNFLKTHSSAVVNLKDPPGVMEVEHDFAEVKTNKLMPSDKITVHGCKHSVIGSRSVVRIVPVAKKHAAVACEAAIKPSKITRKIKTKDRKPQAERVLFELAQVFDNAAEAFVMLDINAGGGVSILELDRGLKRLGIEGVDMDALSKELHLESGVELDADAFIHHFMWHGYDVYPDESWQMAYVEARRQRRRIMARFYERSGMAHEDNSVLGSNWKAKFIADEMEKRLTVQRKFQEALMANMKKGDHRASRKKGVQYIKAGHVYR